MNLSITLQNVARRLPERPAITCDTSVVSYGAFEDRVARIAGSLRGRHGLAQGVRVAIAMENCSAFLEALYGVWRAGLVAVPINAPEALAAAMASGCRIPG